MSEKKSFVFIFTICSGGGGDTVFKYIVQSLCQKYGNPEIFMFIVVDRGNHKEYSFPETVTYIKNYYELLKVRKAHPNITVINFSGDWKSSVVSFFFFKHYISWFHCNPHVMYKAKSGKINFALLRKSKKIVCVCEEQKQLLVDDYHFTNQFEVVYNPLDISGIQKKSEEPLFCDFKYILMVARLDLKTKDFFTVIQAYNKLPAKLKNEYNLVFLGSGKDKDVIQEYCASLQLEKKIFFPGFDVNPYRWMKYAACFVLSTYAEGFGLAPAEAMALKIPVVITQYQTGCAEITDNGKNAVIVEQGNSDAMAQAFVSVLTDAQKVADLTERAFSYIARFDFSAFYAQITHLL